MAKATKKDDSVVTAKPKAGNSLFAAMGAVKVKPKEKEPETPRVKVDNKTDQGKAVCAAIVKFNEERQLEKDHETLKKAAAAVVAPEAKTAHQNLSRLAKLVHKSIHVYDEATGKGLTYQLGRFVPGDEAKGATKEGVSKAALAWNAIQEIFGDKTEDYFRQEVSLSVKEEFCTAETMALLQEKLGDDYARLFEAEPSLGFLKVSASEAMQTLSRDCVLDDAVKANAVKASTAKLINLSYETFK